MTVRDNVSFKYIKCSIVNIIGSGKKSPGLFPCRKATDYRLSGYYSSGYYSRSVHFYVEKHSISFSEVKIQKISFNRQYIKTFTIY